MVKSENMFVWLMCFTSWPWFEFDVRQNMWRC